MPTQPHLAFQTGPRLPELEICRFGHQQRLHPPQKHHNTPSHAYESILFLTVRWISYWIPTPVAIIRDSDQGFCVYYIEFSSKEHVKSQLGWLRRSQCRRHQRSRSLCHGGEMVDWRSSSRWIGTILSPRSAKVNTRPSPRHLRLRWMLMIDGIDQ